ncbi:MAG TPA: DUF2203 domain-containing protein [Candidatus Xenobia bacterium]|nr:DUF2203 domain-containing protein [Candidatus Xenobia bacterium]
MGNEEREQKFFDRQEAEKLLPRIEPLLVDAIAKKKKLEGVEQEFSQVRNRILLYGGIIPPFSYLSERRQEREQLTKAIRTAIESIEETGCVVKDLDLGLVDFPTLHEDEEVYLCWKLGEKRIFYWHRMDEGFAGRKPLDSATPDSDAPKPN